MHKIFFFSCRGLDNLKEVTEELKDTVDEAEDAGTIAHDALASINARADEITLNMDKARQLQDDHADMKFNIGEGFFVFTIRMFFFRVRVLDEMP